MVHINFTQQYILSLGVRHGLQASFFGSLLFSILLPSIFAWGTLETIADIMLGAFFLFWLLLGWSFIPCIIGGMVLVWATNKLSIYKPVHVDDAVLIGFLIGSVITAGIEGVGVFTFWLLANAEKPNQPFTLFTDPTFYAFTFGCLFLGGLVGGYVGQRFMRHLLAKQEMLLSAAAADVHFTAEENPPPTA